MDLDAAFTTETDHTPAGELRIGKAYWNSWDGELFTVVSYPTPTQATVVSINNGTMRTRDKDQFAVDFERVHPVELTGIDGTGGDEGRP